MTATQIVDLADLGDTVFREQLSIKKTIRGEAKKANNKSKEIWARIQFIVTW